MFWADRIAKDITARFGKDGAPIVVRDEKTISGRVHVGSMRGVAIHGAVAEVLAEQGRTNVYRYELNDFDVFDSVPGSLPQEVFEPYLGMLLRDVPSPEPGFESFAHYYGEELRRVIEESGFHPEFYWGCELYESGRMDGVIREAIEHAADVRRIYKEVSGGTRDETWLPINVICPQCKKVATTESADFDGETVAVNCQPNKSEYAKGCGFSGRVSPFRGGAKLPWKVEWAAKWKVCGVMVEGGGKDHSTKGGSRDVANHIARDVFAYEPPFDIPYEFFLVGGKKMSSSKGRGSSAREIADLVPPAIFRLALIGKDINQAYNFDPEGDAIPVLFDQYDTLAVAYWSGVQDDDYARLFEHIHPQAIGGAYTRQAPLQAFLPRFSQIAFLVQMPHLDLVREVASMKGSALTDADRLVLEERATYAKHWLNTCAPEKFVFRLQEALPVDTQDFSDEQRAALRKLLEFVESAPEVPSGEELHERLHAIKTESAITPADLFSAIYRAFLGKSYGPKAGWFLSVLPREVLVRRLREASQ